MELSTDFKGGEGILGKIRAPMCYLAPHPCTGERSGKENNSDWPWMKLVFNGLLSLKLGKRAGGGGEVVSTDNSGFAGVSRLILNFIFAQLCKDNH